MASKVAPARTAATMLKRIDDFLSTAPRAETKALWNVLTALRGPDNGNQPDKRVATMRIRALAFPRLSSDSLPVSAGLRTGAMFAPTGDAEKLFAEKLFAGLQLSAGQHSHFVHHVTMATDSLEFIARQTRKGGK